MARRSTTLAEVLLQTQRRLIEEIEEATEHNTYFSLDDVELPPNPGEFMLQLAPNFNASFDRPQLTGAGVFDCHLLTEIVVTIHFTIQLDRMGWDYHYITDPRRGISYRIQRVLRALTDHDLSNDDNDQILAQPLQPRSLTIPPKKERKRGEVSIAFECEFDWDLSEIPADHFVDLP